MAAVMQRACFAAARRAQALPSTSKAASAARTLHASALQAAVSKFAMPAMSPTMTEGSISEWQVKEGDSFAAGDVLLSIETDKATIDVEAQDDGIMGKILVSNGQSGVKVGSTIAMLAEEGDDISSIEAPADEDSGSSSSSSSGVGAAPKESSADGSATSEQKPASESHPTPSPGVSSPVQHITPRAPGGKTLLPGVMRLLALNGVEDASKVDVKPSGKGGMLTKGDVLFWLGKIKSQHGTAPKDDHATPADEYAKSAGEKKKSAPAAAPEKPLDAPTIRRMVARGLGQAAAPASAAAASSPASLTFDGILSDYTPSKPVAATTVMDDVPVPPVPPPPPAMPAKSGFDEFLGL